MAYLATTTTSECFNVLPVFRTVFLFPFFIWGELMPFTFAHQRQNYFVSGKLAGHASSTKRTGSFIRPTSPKSPVASASAFESGEGSADEDNMTDSAKLDTKYLHTNGNAVSLYNSALCLILLSNLYITFLSLK